MLASAVTESFFFLRSYRFIAPSQKQKPPRAKEPFYKPNYLNQATTRFFGRKVVSSAVAGSNPPPSPSSTPRILGHKYHPPPALNGPVRTSETCPAKLLFTE